VESVESLRAGAHTSPLLDAFDRHGAGQCGFCTPGMLMIGKALLTDDPEPTRERVRLAISGNLCRCTGYGAIVDAIEEASRGGARPPVPDEAHAPLPLPPYGER
jgi:carbon-monoxide dehydrogenase small subunit